ncbi:MAG: ribonuclease P protein component [Clostridiales bacterium]|nr:ribonuclease P protein component [Clostridiales bacterium]
MLFTVPLKNDKDFRRTYSKGRFSANSMITAYFLPNRLSVNRLGITTGKKIGNAVKRNRAKRIIKAAYRLSEIKFPIGFDIVFVARPDIEEKSAIDIEKFIKSRLLKEINKPFKNKAASKQNKSKK